MEPKISIKDVKERTGVSEHTLRYYEKVGLLNVGRLKNGRRFYTEQDVRWIKTLKLLRSTGMSIQDMLHLVRLTRQGDASIKERIAYFKAYQEDLRKQIAMREEAIQIVERKIERHYELLHADSQED